MSNITKNELHEKIEDLLRENAILFLKRGINELKVQIDGDNYLTVEGAKFVYLFLQTSLELASKSYLIRKNKLQKIIKKGREDTTNISDIEIRKSLEDNTLNFIKFENIKQQIRIEMDNERFIIIEEFQKMRNKVIHSNISFSKIELIDLTYDSIYFIVQILLPMLNKKTDKFYMSTPSEKFHEILDEKVFNNLISLPEYILRMNAEANKNSGKVYLCPYCLSDCYGIDEQKCYCCGFDGRGILGSTDCFLCHTKDSVAFDLLNLQENNNVIWNALCLKCELKVSVYVCPKCGETYSFDILSDDRCTPNKCIF